MYKLSVFAFFLYSQKYLDIHDNSVPTGDFFYFETGLIFET